MTKNRESNSTAPGLIIIYYSYFCFIFVGIQKLLEVAGTVPEHKILPITENSRMHASLCLSKIYEDLMSDREREEYRDAVNKYFE